MPERITPLIVCGGSGTRLWPASSASRPKQFLPLFGSRSTFQETLLRVGDAALFERPVIIANRDHRGLVAAQLGEVEGAADIVLEPEGRDSGPAIAAGAAFIAKRRGKDAAILSLAADHAIRDVAGFRSACGEALEGARAGFIVTFGVVPASPATGYGYIEPGEAVAGTVLRVKRFVEKPGREQAELYIRAGFLWNSGNFLFEAGALLDEYAAQEPDTIAAVEAAVARGKSDGDALYLDPAAFAGAQRRSIDYALMEKTARAAVLRAAFDWSDVGSWDAVGELLPHDADGNAARGPSAFHRAHSNVVYSDGPVVALVGVDDLAVIATADGILVARKNDAAGVKSIVERIRRAEKRGSA